MNATEEVEAHQEHLALKTPHGDCTWCDTWVRNLQAATQARSDADRG